MPDPGRDRDVAALARAQRIVDQLREHCGWTAALTPDKLTGYLVEEAHEVQETVRTGALGEELASELGDVLFQLLLHARLGEERGDFALADAADALSEKLLRRNTHVFAADGSVLEHPDADPEAAERAWHEAKLRERKVRAAAGPGGGSQDSGDPFAGLPRSMPALALAQKVVARRRRDGLAAGSAREPGGERIGGDGDATRAEVGAALLGLVERANAAGIDAEEALRAALAAETSTASHRGPAPSGGAPRG